MADDGEVNIMSVELAIQRELAYRRKVAVLQSPSNSNFYRDLRPLEQCGFWIRIYELNYHFYQLQSSNIVLSPSCSPRLCSGSGPRLSGVKRQAPTENLEVLPSSQQHRHANQIDHSFCMICKVPCSGFVSYKQHINGKKHKSKLQELRFGEKDHEKDSHIAHPRLWCELCGIWCMNKDNLKAHLEGQKHKNVLAKGKLARKNGKEIVIQQNYCELCNIWCRDKGALKMHFNGKKHEAELQKLESARKEGARILKQ